MFRFIVLFLTYFLLSSSNVAQISPNSFPESNSNATHHPSSGTRQPRLHAKLGTYVSVVRLRVPRKAQEFFRKAVAAYAKRSLKDAQHNVEAALKVHAEFPEALALFGGIHAMRGDLISAEEKLQASIRTDPTYSPAYVLLAGVYNAETRYRDAQETTDQAVSAGADNWQLQYEIARALIGQTQYQNALAITDIGLRSKNHGTLLHLAKAHALLGLQKYPEATVELRAFLRYQPEGDGSDDARNLLNRVQLIAPQYAAGQ